jgi:hypothetical protein
MSIYDYWLAALAGKKPAMVVDDPQPGFYRKKNGKGREANFVPVAVFPLGDTYVGRVGVEGAGIQYDVTGDKLNELWSWIAGNPISEESYRAVAERGEPWSDAHDPSKNKPEGKSITQMREENPRFDKDLETTFAMIDAGERALADLPENRLPREIAEAKAGVSQYERIDSDTMAGQALSLKNTITSLAGELDKHREALVRPHIDAQREVNERLNPIIKDAKASAAALLRSMGIWEDEKRAAARLAQETADKAAREHAEAVRKAEMSDTEAPPPPSPVLPNTPAPSVQVAAAVGRKASVKVKQFVVSIDEDKAFAMFKGNSELSALLLALAQKAIDAGMPVPGAITEERSVVR